MGLLIFCCPGALVTNLTELTITSYAWMRTSDEQTVVTEAPKKRSKFPNIERMMKAEWDFRHVNSFCNGEGVKGSTERGKGSI